MGKPELKGGRMLGEMGSGKKRGHDVSCPYEEKAGPYEKSD